MNGSTLLAPVRFGPAGSSRLRLLAKTLLVLGLAYLTGCGHSHRRPRSGPEIGAAAPKLKGKSAADVQIAMARTLEERGELVQAAGLYLDALKLDSSRGDAWLRLGTIRDQQGKFAESAECYRKALAARPGSSDAYCNMGYSCYLQNRYGDAEMNLRQALALYPDHRRAHNNLGLVLAHTGRSGEALVEFRSAGCSESEASTNLAFVMTLERRWPEARLHYDNAMASNPNAAPSIRKRLQQLDDLLARTQPSTGAAPEVLPASVHGVSPQSDKAVTPAIFVEHEKE